MGRKRGKAASAPPRAPRYRVCARGLRHVAPYVYEFSTRAKGAGSARNCSTCSRRTIIGALARAAAAIRSGRILVNGARVDADDCVLRAGDLVAHATHRHEPPVSGVSYGR